MPGSTALASQHLFSGLKKRNSLRQEEKGGGKLIPLNQFFSGYSGKGQINSVCQSMIVMTGNIIDSLTGSRGPLRKPEKTLFQYILIAGSTGCESLVRKSEYGAAQSVPDCVVEKGKAWEHKSILLDRKRRIVFGYPGGKLPAFSIEYTVRMPDMNGIHNLPYGFDINESNQVKAETVNMVFIRPVIDGIYNVFADHRALGGSIVSAAGTIGTIFPAEITGNQSVKAEIICVINVVVYHIHNNTDAVIMKHFDHLLHFTDTHFTMIWVCGIGAFRNIEVGRVLTPIITFFPMRQRFGNTQIFPLVTNTGGTAG